MYKILMYGYMRRPVTGLPTDWMKICFYQKKTLNNSWTPQHHQMSKGINIAGLCKHCSNQYFKKILVLESSIKITKIKPRDVRQFSRATVTKTCILQIVAIAWKNRYLSPMLKNYWMKNRITEWLNETIWIIEWFHTHWVPNCYLGEKQEFIGSIFSIKEPQNSRFYKNCFSGLQAS